ncbi:hypothetical protein PR048_030881 [Dryococelus australis]|uniref:Reverse transcriptase domain-containing protein n=1 Tax=Dryococelus australis TaxID=614101 RepID=A0ABQ9GCT0_9NEOP|nr:hypothetical protein PR048_030881 [Dryococelus australis]
METGLQIGRKVNILAYADDVVLVGKNKEELREIMMVLVKEIMEVELETNIEKTKYLPISRCHHVGPRGDRYGWKLLKERNVMEKEILTRIQAENRSSFSMGQIFGPVKEADEWRRRKNRELRNLYQLPDIVAVIKGQRLRWYGHIMRRDGDLVQDVVERCFGEKKPRGRHRFRWLDAIKEDIRKALIHSRGGVEGQSSLEKASW